MMRRVLLALLIALTNGSGLAAADSKSEIKIEPRIEAMLKRIEPADRLEQVCDYAAAKRIGRDKNPYHPDRAVIDSISPFEVEGDTIKGNGGAFRSRGEWYQFSFTCKTTPDRLKILSFDYHVGEKIPEDKWNDYGLWR
jgi:Domain of Unknown Function (DUF930)